MIRFLSYTLLKGSGKWSGFRELYETGENPGKTKSTGRMIRMKRALALLLGIFMFLAACPVSLAAGGVLGQEVPDFVAATTEGTVHLKEILQEKKAVVVTLWTTYCGACYYEFPALQKIYEKYQDDVEIIALSTYFADTMEDIRAYGKEMGLTFTMGREQGTGLGRYINSEYIPITFVVDRFGKMGFLQIGAFNSASQIERVLEPFLAENYTRTQVLTEIPEIQVKAEAVSSGELTQALCAEGCPLVFDSVKDGRTWPMVPAILDGRNAVMSTNGGAEGTSAQCFAEAEIPEDSVLAMDVSMKSDAGMSVAVVDLDGNEVMRFMGNHDRTSWALPVPAGKHRIDLLCYRGFEEGQDGAETVWFENVRLLHGEEASQALKQNVPAPQGKDFGIRVADAEACVQVDKEQNLYADEMVYFVPERKTVLLEITLREGMFPASGILENMSGTWKMDLHEAFSTDGTHYYALYEMNATTDYDAISFVPDPFEQEYQLLYLLPVTAEEMEEVRGYVDEQTGYSVIACAGADVDLSQVRTWPGAKQEGASLRFLDEDGKGVADCYVNVCTDDLCETLKSDEQGKILISADRKDGHLQILKVPEGFALPEEEPVMKSGEEQIVLLRKKEDRARYIVHFQGPEGENVAGCYVNFCTDNLCQTVSSDAKGNAVMEGEAGIYHLQILKVPEGYTFDSGWSRDTDRTGGTTEVLLMKK